MNEIGYEGIGAVVATTNADKDVAPGTMVKMGSDDVVFPCEDGDAFVGVALGSRFHSAQVQFQGAVRVKCEDGISPGWNWIVADGKGGIRAAEKGESGAWEENARQYLILNNDAENKTAVIWL